MVEQQLDDDPGVLAVVLDTDHPHDVSCVLRIRVLRILVGQNHNRISILSLDFTLRIRYSTNISSSDRSSRRGILCPLIW